jgi:hypothetical protein
MLRHADRAVTAASRRTRRRSLIRRVTHH